MFFSNCGVKFLLEIISLKHTHVPYLSLSFEAWHRYLAPQHRKCQVYKKNLFCRYSNKPNLRFCKNFILDSVKETCHPGICYPISKLIQQPLHRGTCLQSNKFSNISTLFPSKVLECIVKWTKVDDKLYWLIKDQQKKIGKQVPFQVLLLSNIFDPK